VRQGRRATESDRCGGGWQLYYQMQKLPAEKKEEVFERVAKRLRSSSMA
jgi:hypothetical protein